MEKSLTQLQIEHSGIVTALAKPGADILDSLTPNTCHILHMTMGIMGEVLELRTEVMRHSHSVRGITEETVKECGDIEFYLRGLCHYISVPIDTLFQGVTTEEPTCPYSDAMPLYVNTLIDAAGDLLELVKKFVMYCDDSKLPGIIKAAKQVCCELDDFYIGMGIDRKTVLAENVAKLSKRYHGGKFDNAQAQKRVDVETESGKGNAA